MDNYIRILTYYLMFCLTMLQQGNAHRKLSSLLKTRGLQSAELLGARNLRPVQSMATDKCQLYLHSLHYPTIISICGQYMDIMNYIYIYTEYM